MNKQLNALSVVIGTVIALAGASASAEQTIGVQLVPAVSPPAAVATAKVNVSVLVQKIVVLRIGDANATSANVTFTTGTTPATIGNSQAYTGDTTADPIFATTIATTNPTSTAGALTVAAWTNASGNAHLTCALTALSGNIAFATGATASGVPGTDNITVASIAGATDLQHPGLNLTGCTGTAATSSIAKLTTYGGTFTYGTNYVAKTLVAGTYGNTVTYTATTL